MITPRPRPHAFVAALLAALSLLTLGMISTAHAQQKSIRATSSMGTKSFPWQGEELYFKIMINGSEAGHASVRVGQVRKAKRRSYIPLSARAQSVGFFHTIYPLDDKANTFLDSKSHFPLRSEKVFREAGKARAYKVSYAHGKYEAVVDKTYLKSAKNPTERKRNFSRAIPRKTHDSFSWFFAIRAEPNLAKEGSKFVYHIYDGWKLSRLVLTVVGKDRVLTPMGWHDAIKVDFTREILRSSFQHKKNKRVSPKLTTLKPAKPLGSIWFTDDSRHLPVKINMSSATYGIGEIVLAKYTAPNGKNKKRKSKKP